MLTLAFGSSLLSSSSAAAAAAAGTATNKVPNFKGLARVPSSTANASSCFGYDFKGSLPTPARPIPSFKTAVAAIDSNELSPPAKQQGGKYYFVIANAKFMLDEEEHFQELLFERLRNYEERNKERDFWLVIEPKFLDKFPLVAKRLKRPAVALVSTNGPWITFMKLRLDRVLSDSYEADSVEEALASNPPTTLEFEKPENWVAPYPKYEYGWWETFLPAASI